MKIELNPWGAPAVIIALGGAVAILGYMLFYRIPDLEKRTDHVETSVHDELRLVTLQLVNIRSNLLRVCSSNKQLDKTCKVEELVSQASELSKLQADFLDGGTIRLSGGDIPNVASNELKRQLVSLEGLPIETVSSKADIARLLTWSSAAQSATWVRKNKLIEVKFTNGRAEFQPSASLSGKSIDQLVDSLNDSARAFSASFAQ